MDTLTEFARVSGCLCKSHLAKLVSVCFVIATLCITSNSAHAQTTLTLFSPVTGQIESGNEQPWTFSALSGAVLSFLVQKTSGNLDPAFRIANSSGMVLISNDDFDYPTSRDSMLEGITMPRTDTYTLTVSGGANTSGDYLLTMTSGFSQIEGSENFNGALTWEAVAAPLTVTADSGQLSLALAGADQSGIAIDKKAKTVADYYTQVNVNVTGDSGWLVGMTAREQDADHYYLLQINEAGQWRFILHQPDGDHSLRDWTPHPAIAVGNASFTLGMLVNGSGFDFFYNGQFFGHMNDATLSNAGQIGLAIGTLSSLSSKTTALFDDLSITEPLQINGKRLIPQQLLGGKPSDSAQELQRRSLIPAGGQMDLTVSSSFVQSQRPGVQQVTLARGTTYQNFAMGSTISWTAASSGVTGCGLVFRSTDDTHYSLAYLDQSGGYGVSQRDGDAFKPGIFGEVPSSKQTDHELLVIAWDSQLIYYVDDLFSGTLDNSATTGAVGNAVVNFEPISTSCQFTDTWVWDFSALTS